MRSLISQTQTFAWFSTPESSQSSSMALMRSSELAVRKMSTQIWLVPALIILSKNLEEVIPPKSSHTWLICKQSTSKTSEPTQSKPPSATILKSTTSSWTQAATSSCSETSASSCISTTSRSKRSKVCSATASLSAGFQTQMLLLRKTVPTFVFGTRSKSLTKSQCTRLREMWRVSKGRTTRQRCSSMTVQAQHPTA